MTAPVRIGNASGFYGDRFEAVQEMLTGGDLDVLTGDYLAELTMLILGRDRARDPSTGYAKTFLRQLEGSLARALERGVRIVSNAGGLNPAALARALRELADRFGLSVRIAHVEGDDLLPRAAELGLGRPLAANAYLGGWGIAACLRAGADVVVTGRVTDASLVVGPAAAHFGWGPDDHDALAGAVVAGHVIECGAQATGGNYALFTELVRAGVDLTRPGFPIAEVSADGSSVITKHPGTGGAVTVGTVTAQLLYEVDGPRYLGPDVTTRLDTVRLTQDGPDRVAIVGVRGEPPPDTLKVGLNLLGGYRNEITFVLTGLDVTAKAELTRAQLDAALRVRPATVEWQLARTDQPDADTEQTASALLRCTVRDRDPAVVGRAFSGAAVELALAGYPGFFATTPPAEASPYGVFTAAYLPAELIEQVAVLDDGSRLPIAPAPSRCPGRDGPTDPSITTDSSITAEGRSRREPLGRVVGARSGDKGGSANLGVWARTEAAWPWLLRTLTVDRLRELLPETAPLPVTRHVLANLRAVNFVIEGLLGEGVAAQHRFDPQAKGLGEWLRSRLIEIPEDLL
jgi:hypothetical protein